MQNCVCIKTECAFTALTFSLYGFLELMQWEQGVPNQGAIAIYPGLCPFALSLACFSISSGHHFVWAAAKPAPPINTQNSSCLSECGIQQIPSVSISFLFWLLAASYECECAANMAYVDRWLLWISLDHTDTSVLSMWSVSCQWTHRGGTKYFRLVFDFF